MPFFSYNCSDHGDFRVLIDKREKVHLCPKCGKECKFVLKSLGTIKVMEKLDNGIMPRAVERIANIEEIMKDREKKMKEFTKTKGPDDDKD